MAKKMSAVKLAVLVILIVASAVFFFEPLVSRIGLGLDLQGGVHVVLQARPEAGSTVTADEMRQLQSVMRQRVDEFGVSEPIIQLSGDDRLVVELAGVDDPEQAVELIGKTAKLEFVNSDGKVVVDGSMLKDASAQYGEMNQPEIRLEFNTEGARLFEEETRRLVSSYGEGDPNRVLSIHLDDEVLMAPFVRQTIANGVASISGGMASLEEAANLASLLRGGALPVSTEIIEKRTVGPTLGSDSLDSSVTAIIVGLLLLAAYMLVVYRLPGMVANLSLVVFGMLMMLGLLAFRAVLTLPGLAGILLTVAMAADANIIIYERIKDELRSGKTLRAAVESGFSRASLTILDSNITTIIGAAVLFQFGAGSIRGFALTLMIGIAINMITALFLTRGILRLVVQVPAFQNKALYGPGMKGVELK